MYQARVVDVYDGDTIRVVIFRRNEKQQHRVRMLGYDSPEKKPRLNVQNREAEIKAALRARDVLIRKIHQPRQLVRLECGKFDKYGRLLGTIHVDGVNVNQWMIKNEFGVPYGGGTKTSIQIITAPPPTTNVLNQLTRLRSHKRRRRTTISAP